ncbi:hypothetical protein N0V85_009150 [Neurospora sp. IMI 360204]|nr:hypothetical protein N0V85_009150 [Neurospora sp. IMI 360204]
MDQYRMKDYCRYLHFPESTFNDIDMDPSTNIPFQVDITPDEDGNLESEKATFFLHGLILEETGADYYPEEWGLDLQTVSEFASAVPFAWDWSPESRTGAGIRGPEQGKDRNAFIRKRTRFGWMDLMTDLLEMLRESLP